MGCDRPQTTNIPGRELPPAPRAKQVPHTLTTHGESRSDEFYWLRDDDRNDPEVLAYLEAENAYTENVMAPLAEFRSVLYDEIVGRIAQDDSTVPHREGGHFYFRRYEEGKEHPIFCRREGAVDGPERVLLDANVEAEGQDYYQVAATSVSPDGNTLAYAEDTLGRRIHTIRFRTIGEDGEGALTDTIEGTSGAMAWASDNRTFFYVKRDESTLRAYQVYRHVLGTPVADDVLVYQEDNDEFWMSLGKTSSKEYIVIGSYQTISHEIRLIPASRPTEDPHVFLPREEHHEYDVDHFRGRFYIRTNFGARDFRLMSTDLAHTTDKTAWQVEIPAREGVFFSDFAVFDGFLVSEERQDALLGLRVIPWEDREGAYRIDFEDEVYVAGLGSNRETDTDVVRLSYQSMTTPDSVIDFNMTSRSRQVLKQDQVLGGFNAEDYVSERLTVTARDGAQVPVSLMYRRDLDRSQPQPLLLYGYGAYGYSMDPWFRSSRLSLLDRGVVYAIAHIRGGQERGRRWYEEGKLLEKMNTFTDFIDVGQHLVDSGWTASDRLFAQGGSAGGLLMGAVANMRPDLFSAVVANVPFVDVLTTMLDESIPLTTFEYDEWGNPNERRYFDYIAAYSPYDNVSAQDYPHMLVLGGLHDSQVQYWEPAKWVARLRARKTDDHQLLMWMNMEAGHGGASGRFRQHEETARIYAFLLDLIGVRR